MSRREAHCQAIARLREICENRDQRARELREKGQKIIGYFCCYPPVEIMTAASLVPYRILGNAREPITVADAYVPAQMCPYIRSCVDCAAKGYYDFLDGFVVPHSCDQIEKLFDQWVYHFKPPYSHFIEVPHVVRPAALEYFQIELELFRKNIEKFSQTAISEHRLLNAIRLHNQNRALMRELYELRKEEPPLVSGSAVTQTIIASTSLPVEESNQLLRNIIAEAKRRHDGPRGKGARLLVYGNEIDDPAFIQLIEDCGANVVMDDLCLGSRSYWHDVQEDGDPLSNLAQRYLGKIMCPRTHRDHSEDRQKYLEDRFNYLRQYISDFKVNGVILSIIRYCDTHEYDAPDVRDYVKGQGIPVLHLEHEYSMSALAPLRTRIEAFVEMVQGNR